MLSALILLTVLLQGCTGGFDDDVFDVTITNNTGSSIVDHTFFGAACGVKDVSPNGQVITVSPGETFAVAEFANEGTDPDRITTLSGRTLGCLPFQFSENPPVQPVVKVTQMVPCRHYGYEVTYPRDWPNPKY